jgi:hypothetical protein
LILKARQLGISTFVSLLFLDRCLFNSNQHTGIIAHTREDAEMLFRRVKFAYDSLPVEIKALRMANTDNARELQLSNGSTLRVGTSMRSSTLQYLHISEFGKICAKYPDKAREIVTGALNAIAPVSMYSSSRLLKAAKVTSMTCAKMHKPQGMRTSNYCNWTSAFTSFHGGFKVITSSILKRK